MLKDAYNIEFIRQEIDLLRTRVAQLEAESARHDRNAKFLLKEHKESVITLSSSLGLAWERIGIMVNTLFPNLSQAETEVNNVLGVKSNEILSSKGDGIRDIS